ncbi:hypothetical protein N7G274_004801 [Stereocaulon virgatum]|uniref:ATPase AAA-type core domain-containing protein n=1 Tax=Stereocaulon virgatum TaxID=373712 RepID=A0ABR4A8U5_9LECA
MDDSFRANKASANVFDDYQKHNSGLQTNTDLAIVTSLRGRYPDWEVTVTPSNTGLLHFAKAGMAESQLDIETDDFLAWRMHSPTRDRTSQEPGTMSDNVEFGKYYYRWNDENFIVYSATCQQGLHVGANNHYVLHKRGHNLVDGRCKLTDDLIAAASQWSTNVHDEVLVFDQGMWTKNSELWASVQSSSWDDVIMNEDMKETLVKDVEGFFGSREEYKEFVVPWKRGIIFHGLPGNGKTISIKALMHALYKRSDPIPTLYVKSLAGCHGPEYAVRQIFVQARQYAPCLLVFEDLDSLITDQVKSFFLNEVDGLESNEGLMMLGSTNYLERLDAGISKRPGRFDRKYHFTLPALPERVKYCEYWRSKLAKNNKIDFPPKLSEAIGDITEGFSFAYLKETFITSLLMIVGSRKTSKDIEGLSETTETHDELSSLLLWRVMSKQEKTLRSEMEDARRSAEEAAASNSTNGASNTTIAPAS